MRTLQRELGRFLGGGRKPRQPDLDRKEREAFKRLAAKHGFAWEKARDGYLEIAPGETFPEGLTTAFYGWGETLARVEYCLEHPEAVVDGGYQE